jgi:hypothetical protein
MAYQDGDRLGAMLAAAAARKATVAVTAARRKLAPGDLDCELLQERLAADELARPKQINFLAAAVGDRYEDYLPLYAFYAHSSNTDAVVEMVVADVGAFVSRNLGSLGWLRDHFGVGAFCVRGYTGTSMKETRWIPNSRRFLEVPVVRARYTYIADIDIFITEPVVEPLRLFQMKFHGVPYSDIIRNATGTRRLTGLILVETAAFFTPRMLMVQRAFIGNVETYGHQNDEALLLHLVVAAGHGAPPLPDHHAREDFARLSWHGPRDAADLTGTGGAAFFSQYRPQHGLHLSLNRGGPPGQRIMGISLSMEPWCVFLSFPHLVDFLVHDAGGLRILQDFHSRVVLQIVYSDNNKRPVRKAT